MKASTGIDYAEFFLFLHIIASQRLVILEQNAKEPSSHQDVSKTSQEDRTSLDRDVSCYIEHSMSKLTCKEQTNSNDTKSRTHSTEEAAAEVTIATGTPMEGKGIGHVDTLPVTSCQRSLDGGADSLWHMLFDINQVQRVLECLLRNEEFQELDTDVLSDDPKQLYCRICDVMREYQGLK